MTKDTWEKPRGVGSGEGGGDGWGGVEWWGKMQTTVLEQQLKNKIKVTKNKIKSDNPQGMGHFGELPPHSAICSDC